MAEGIEPDPGAANTKAREASFDEAMQALRDCMKDQHVQLLPLLPAAVRLAPSGPQSMTVAERAAVHALAMARVSRRDMLLAWYRHLGGWVNRLRAHEPELIDELTAPMDDPRLKPLCRDGSYDSLALARIAWFVLELAGSVSRVPAKSAPQDAASPGKSLPGTLALLIKQGPSPAWNLLPHLGHRGRTDFGDGFPHSLRRGLTEFGSVDERNFPIPSNWVFGETAQPNCWAWLRAMTTSGQGSEISHLELASGLALHHAGQMHDGKSPGAFGHLQNREHKSDRVRAHFTAWRALAEADPSLEHVHSGLDKARRTFNPSPSRSEKKANPLAQDGFILGGGRKKANFNKKDEDSVQDALAQAHGGSLLRRKLLALHFLQVLFAALMVPGVVEDRRADSRRVKWLFEPLCSLLRSRAWALNGLGPDDVKALADEVEIYGRTASADYRRSVVKQLGDLARLFAPHAPDFDADTDEEGLDKLVGQVHEAAFQSARHLALQVARLWADPIAAVDPRHAALPWPRMLKLWGNYAKVMLADSRKHALAHYHREYGEHMSQEGLLCRYRDAYDRVMDERAAPQQLQPGDARGH